MKFLKLSILAAILILCGESLYGAEKDNNKKSIMLPQPTILYQVPSLVKLARMTVAATQVAQLIQNAQGVLPAQSELAQIKVYELLEEHSAKFSRDSTPLLVELIKEEMKNFSQRTTSFSVARCQPNRYTTKRGRYDDDDSNPSSKKKRRLIFPN